MENEQKKSGNKLFLILTIILVLLSAFLGWQLYDQKNQKDQVIVEKNTLTAEKARISGQLDSLLGEYNQVEAANGSLSDSLEAKKNRILDLQAHLDDAMKDAKKMQWYRSQVNSLKKDFAALQTVNDSLLQVNQALHTENEQVKGDLQEQKSVNQDLTNENMGLANQVAIGSILKAYEVSALGVRTRGSKEKETDKAKRVEKIKTCFTLSENKITKSGMKNIYVRIEDPMGKVMAEGMGANNTFTLNGETVGYSVKDEVMYDNSAMPLCIYFNKTVDFTKGTYHITLYEDRAEIGTATLDLR